jgi:hypothetical protein
VWRRDDGYVSCTTYNPGSGFDVLLVTESWPEARLRILAEQDERHHSVVASWGSGTCARYLNSS